MKVQKIGEDYIIKVTSKEIIALQIGMKEFERYTKKFDVLGIVTTTVSEIVNELYSANKF